MSQLQRADPEPQTTSLCDRDSHVHPLSALVLIVVDNLWNLTEWAVIDWIITIPLSFITVLTPVFLIQKFLGRNTTARALAFAILFAFLAAVPFSVMGTFAGSTILAWLGLDRWRRHSRSNESR